MLNNSGPILIVDDDKLEVLLVKRSLSKLGSSKQIDHVGNGLEAIQYLNDSNNNPSIILLDVNMPKMNGLEFLRERDSNPEWLKIPTIILSSSNESSDKEKALKLGACGYMIKPMEFEDMTKMLKAILDYWSLSETVE